MTLEHLLVGAGTVAATALIAMLTAGRWQDRWRIWPAPPAGSLQSFAFWTLFRTLNVAVLALSGFAAVRTAQNGESSALHLMLFAISALAFAVYLYALWSLGRPATYCQPSGLATDGIYRWTRNPQYATAIVAYAALGLAVATPTATALSAALVTVYALMAVVEEPWLSETYGADYARYCSQVPRFFNFALARRLLLAQLTRQRLPIKSPQSGRS